jgi:hypothetical protein
LQIIKLWKVIKFVCSREPQEVFHCASFLGQLKRLTGESDILVFAIVSCEWMVDLEEGDHIEVVL